jgi:hypothetical protein
MLMPNGMPKGGHRESRRASASAPALLNPIRLTIARGTNRNKRGVGLPGWGRGVTVPTSTKPNPNAAHAVRASAIFIEPRRQPHRVGEPQRSRSRLDHHLAPRIRRTSPNIPHRCKTGVAHLSAAIPSRCAVSGGNKKRTGEQTPDKKAMTLSLTKRPWTGGPRDATRFGLPPSPPGRIPAKSTPEMASFGFWN